MTRLTTFVPEPRLLDSPRHRDWPFLTLGASSSGVPSCGASPVGTPPGSADVVIVGAGPAGLAVASTLWHLGVRDVVLLDRDGRRCGRFLDRIDVLGQRVLRSPYQHHPGVEGYRDCELLDFARLHWARLTPVERREIRMAQAGHRSVVPVDVFEAYCAHIAAIHGVAGRTWRAAVTTVEPGPDRVVVRGVRFTVRASYVVLCLGESRTPAPSRWWGNAAEPPEGVSYWTSPVPSGGGGPLVVVGAGLTAAHLLANALRSGRRVRWVLRESRERYQCNDVNAAFFRAEGRVRFDGAVAWQQRSALMRAQRRASIMFEFRPLLAAAEASGQLEVHRGHPIDAVGPGLVVLADGTRVAGEHVVLALGTSPSTGAGLLPPAAVGHRDGWPDLDERTLAYRRAPRVLAVGAAAGMVLGPAARNIDGHRVATARVAATVATGLGAGAVTAVGPDRMPARA